MKTCSIAICSALPEFVKILYASVGYHRTPDLAAVIATGCLSVCLSVRPSVMLRCVVQTNEDYMIVRFSASGRKIILFLVSEEVNFILIFAGYTPSEGVKVEHPL